MASMNPPDRARVLQLLSYDPDTGVILRRIKRPGRAPAGSIAGSRHRAYIIIGVDGVNYPAHVLAWFMVTGEWLIDKIDHQDGDGFNNRWTNLREATRTQNSMNRGLRCDNATGLKGVIRRSEARYRKRPYVARITVAGKLRSLGYYATAEEGHAAYLAAAKVHFGEFARAA